MKHWGYALVGVWAMVADGAHMHWNTYAVWFAAMTALTTIQVVLALQAWWNR